MTPTRYSIKNETTYFHYKFSDLRRFVYYALKEGNAGALLIARRGNILIYKTSGTIEHPQRTPLKSIRELYTLSMTHNNIFDGETQTDDERLIEKPSLMEKLMKTAKLVFLDMSDYQEEKPNIQKLGK